ncbi:PucR family transcriptional regulator ligand-binding domain-containing protein, partial [Streptomyces mayteni]
MRLRTLLETGPFGLRLLAGEPELDRRVRGVMTTDLRDPSRYLRGGELVLTGLAWWRGPGDAEPFVRILTAAGVAGLAAGEAEFGAVPEDLTAACARHGLPLFAVGEEVGFADITEFVVRRVSGERAGDLAAVVDRHRRLMSAGPAGGGPGAVLDLLGTDLDLRAWLLSASGRPIAATGGEPLPAGVAGELCERRLAAAGAGRRGPSRAAVGGETYSLFPVGDEEGDPRRTLLSGWLLAVLADAGEWPPERLDLLDGVARLVAAERDRREASRTVQRRLAREVVELTSAGAPPAEVAARLRVAAPVLGAGGAEPYWQVVATRVAWAGAEFDTGQVGRALLEELLPTAAVADGGVEAVALVPLP